MDAQSQTLKNIMDQSFSQNIWAQFLVEGIPPAERPELPLIQLTFQYLSNIVVAFMITGGSLPPVTETSFWLNLTMMGAFKHSEIDCLWRELIANKETFFLVGTSMLKSFVLAVKDAYRENMIEEAFVDQILSETDPYFHETIKTVMAEEIFV